MTTRMPAMVPAQEAGWIALIEIASLMPTGWTLVGGQMVHLHCIERGQTPMRATVDLDAILLRVADLQGQDLGWRDIRHLRAMIPRVTEEGADVQDAERGIAMLKAAIRRSERH